MRGGEEKGIFAKSLSALRHPTRLSQVGSDKKSKEKAMASVGEQSSQSAVGEQGSDRPSAYIHPEIINYSLCLKAAFYPVLSVL